MPVSYQQLFSTAEPDVITVGMTRECIVLKGGDQEHNAEKRKVMDFREVEDVALSFRSLVKIDNLHGLENLTKLQLDNNRITVIENLSHLTNLTWLDLSFNQIENIKGLDALVNLTDLSLFNNKIYELEGLEKLTKLHVLSIGNNQLNKLDKVMYLRQFRNLQLVNLSGNPICREANYQSYLLSHIRNLTYLDYRRVKADEVQAAMELHQDEMLDLREKEEVQEHEEREAEKKAENDALMREANLEGVDTFFEDMTKDDPEWLKLSQVPGLVDGWTEVKDKFQTLKDEFKVQVLEQHDKKQSEYAEWLETMKGGCDQKDREGRARIMAFEKHKKHLVRKDKLMDVKNYLMSLEVQMAEFLEEFVQSLDRNYSEMAEQTKQCVMAFFTSVRDMEDKFTTALTTTALKLYDDKYNVENGDALEALSEDAKTLMSDKDILMTSIQASHDVHTSKMDALEDALVNNEVGRANALVSKHRQWAYQRNRDRIAEIITYTERNMQEVDALMHDGEEDYD